MGFSAPLKDIIANAAINTGVYPNYHGASAEQEQSSGGVSFDRVFRDTHFGSTAETQDATADTDPITFSAGAEIEKMSAMSQVRDLFFSDELSMFDDNEDLDDAINFDEIEQLDTLTDDEVSRRADTVKSSTLTDETADFLDSVLSDDDELIFSDIEEL